MNEIIWYLSFSDWFISLSIMFSRTLFALWVGMQTGAATMESSVEIPQKIKSGSAFDPVIPLLGIYPKEPKTLIQKNISTPMFTAALFTRAKIWKQPKCPSVDEWIQKLLCLARWFIWLEHCPMHQGVACSIPGQEIYLSWFNPQLGHVWEAID